MLKNRRIKSLKDGGGKSLSEEIRSLRKLGVRSLKKKATKRNDIRKKKKINIQIFFFIPFVVNFCQRKIPRRRNIRIDTRHS